MDGEPDAIKLSVLKLRDAARPCLGESHDISVGINALQILVRLSRRVYEQTPYGVIDLYHQRSIGSLRKSAYGRLTVTHL